MLPLARSTTIRRLPPLIAGGSCAISSSGSTKSKSVTRVMLVNARASPGGQHGVAPHDVVEAIAPDDVVLSGAGNVAPDDVVVPEAPHHLRGPDLTQQAVAPHDI